MQSGLGLSYVPSTGRNALFRHIVVATPYTPAGWSLNGGAVQQLQQQISMLENRPPTGSRTSIVARLSAAVDASLPNFFCRVVPGLTERGSEESCWELSELRTVFQAAEKKRKGFVGRILSARLQDGPEIVGHLIVENGPRGIEQESSTDERHATNSQTVPMQLTLRPVGEASVLQGAWEPKCSVYDNRSRSDGRVYRNIDVEAPGVKFEDVEVTAMKNGVLISMHKTRPNDESSHLNVQEDSRGYGLWQRHFVFESEDAIYQSIPGSEGVSMYDGVLNVRLLRVDTNRCVKKRSPASIAGDSIRSKPT